MDSESASDPQQQLLEAQSRLRHLKRSLGPAAAARQTRSWKQLRRSLETLRDMMSAWTTAVEGPEEPRSLRRRNELEARALRVESALRELEERQGSLDGERERALAELERVQDGWRLLREESVPPPLEGADLKALRSKVSDVASAWERKLAAHGEAQRERQAIDRIWRWILSVSLPTLEKRAVGSDRSVMLPALRRLLEDLDRRWKDSYSSPAAQTPEGALAAAQDLIAAREGRIAVLARELEFLKGSLDEARGQSARWQDLCENAREGARALERELDSRQAALSESEHRRQAAEKGLSRAHEELAQAAERLEQARSRRDEDLRWKEAQKERQRLAALLQEAKQESDARRLALEEARREREKILAVLAESEERAKALEGRASELERRLESHKAPLDIEIARLKGDGQILQKALDGSRQAFDEANARAKLLQEELLAAKADLATLDQAHLVLSRKAEDLEAERQKQDERERALLEEQVRLRNRTAEAEGHAADRDEEVARLNAAIEEQAARLKNDFQEQSARLVAEMEALRERDRELADEASKLRRQAAQALGLAQARRAEAERSKAEAEEARSRADEAQSQAAAAQAEEAKVRAAAADTSRRLQNALARIQASIDSTESAASAVAKAAADAAALKAKEDAARAEPPLDWPKILARVREPLTSAYAGLRKAAALLPEAQRGALRPVSAPLIETSDLLRLLAEFVAEGGPAPAPVKAEALLAALVAWRPALRKRKIIVKRTVADKIPAALVEAAGLRQALNQLLRNAYDAMPGGGKLDIRLSYDGAARQVLLSICDSGKGFSKEALETLFKPFVTEKKGRLGLGLALTRKIVRRWGGEVEAANVKDAGAQVVLRLPAEKPVAEPSPAR